MKFTIQRDGTMTDIEIDQTSRNPVLDLESAARLITKRLPPLPAAFTRPTLTVFLSFRLQALMTFTRFLTAALSARRRRVDGRQPPQPPAPARPPQPTIRSAPPSASPGCRRSRGPDFIRSAASRRRLPPPRRIGECCGTT